MSSGIEPGLEMSEPRPPTWSMPATSATWRSQSAKRQVAGLSRTAVQPVWLSITGAVEAVTASRWVRLQWAKSTTMPSRLSRRRN